MKILLVLPYNRSYVVQPNLGLGYLASAIRNAGHEVKILDCIKDKIKPPIFFSMLRKYPVDMVGFTMFSQDYTVIQLLSKIVKDVNSKIYTIAGGAHPSGDIQNMINNFPHLDFIFRGEGEIEISRLLGLLSQGCTDKRELSKINGLYYKERDPKSVSSVFIEDLDSLSFPAWDLMRPDLYPQAPHGAFFKQFPTAPIIITRGCPCQCTFCAGAQRNFRKRSIGNVMNEINFLNKNYGVREFLLEDENFSSDRMLLLEFCEALLRFNKGFTWSFPSGVRLSHVNLEDTRLMEKAGCHSISVGIEFGSQRVHDLTKKGMSIGLIKEKLEILAKTNMRITGFFMLGIPGETLEEMRKTIQFALTLPIHRIQVNNFMPLPGSKIWGELEAEGQLAGIDYSRFFVHNVAHVSSKIKRKDIKGLQRVVYLKFYFRWKIIKRVFTDIKSFKHLKYLIKRFMDALS